MTPTLEVSVRQGLTSDYLDAAGMAGGRSGMPHGSRLEIHWTE